MRKTTIAIAISAATMSLSSFDALANDSVEKTDAKNKNIERQQQVNKTSAAKKAKTKDIEKISVTGSRIQLSDAFSSSTPMMALDSEAISTSGIGSLSDVLIDEIPALAEGVSNLNSGSSVQNSGLSTIDLRRLGTDRTLTLIDGRRAVSNSYSGNYISTSTIPSGMVERTEIISGGASAVYGSDAIAGVVNIITRQDKEGLEFKVRGGTTTEGGGDELSLSLNYGTDFADSRGYLYIATDYEREYGIKWQDRKRAQIEADYDYNYSLMCNEMATVTGDQCMRDITQADWRSRSDGIRGGVFEEESGGVGGYWYDENGLRDDWREEEHGVNTAQYNMLKTPDEALVSALKLTYDVNDDVEFTFQVQYSGNNADNVKSPEDEYERASALYLDPETGEASQVRPGYIDPDNPFAPAEIAENAGSRISWDRRFYEVGPVTTSNKRTTIRSWTGLNGTMFDGEWDWDVSLGYGQFKQRQTRLNELNTIRVAQALDAQYAEDGVTIQCADESAREQGCVPLNIFGVNSITPDAADWIRANPKISTDIEQINFVGFITGDLFTLPAGNVSSAFGYEYRKDTQTLKTNKEQQFGGVTFNVVPSFKGSIEVNEVFGEVHVPLLRNEALAKSLDIDASLRLADYDIDAIDLMSSYRFGFSWQPIDGYVIRANYARAQRAPNITELMSPPRGDFDSYDDICDEVTATSTADGHDNCRLEPSIAALIADDPDFEFEDDNNGYSPNAGNSNLKEETADTYTFGIVMSPEFIDNFKLAVDYYDIKIDDAIAEIGNEENIRQCYNSTLSIDNNQFCDSITRDDDGQITEILQRQFNLAEVATRGVDVVAQYRYRTDNYGRFKFSLSYNHVIEHFEKYQGNDGIEKLRFDGELDSGIFKDKAAASISWKKDDWSIRWSTSWRGKMVDSFEREKEWFEARDENQALIDAGDEDAVLDPETPKYLYFGSYIKHNLSVSKSIDVGDTDIKITGGIRNLFDNTGPFIPSVGDVVSSSKGNTSSKYGGNVGRYAYLGATFKF